MATDRRVGRFLCSEVLARLPGVVDGSLDPADLGDLRLHVASCDACERFGGEYAAVVKALRASADPAADPDPDALADRLLARITG